jgi:Ca2+-binding EF-hand superfamily protein
MLTDVQGPAKDLTDVRTIMKGMDRDRDGHLTLKELTAYVGDETKLSPERAVELQGWKDGFIKADFDKNGRLSLVELAYLFDHVPKMGQQEPVDESPAELCATILKGMDYDRDGMLSLKELTALVGDESRLSLERAKELQGWKDGFIKADFDNNGRLSLVELTYLFDHVPKQEQPEPVEETPAELTATILRGMDYDKDGMLSLKELTALVGDERKLSPEKAKELQAWKDGFKQADVDFNGHLSLEELQSLLEDHAPRTQKDEM